MLPADYHREAVDLHFEAGSWPSIAPDAQSKRMPDYRPDAHGQPKQTAP